MVLMFLVVVNSNQTHKCRRGHDYNIMSNNSGHLCEQKHVRASPDCGGFILLLSVILKGTFLDWYSSSEKLDLQQRTVIAVEEARSGHWTGAVTKPGLRSSVLCLITQMGAVANPSTGQGTCMHMHTHARYD
jgi:hypothetical protein